MQPVTDRQRGGASDLMLFLVKPAVKTPLPHICTPTHMWRLPLHLFFWELSLNSEWGIEIPVWKRQEKRTPLIWGLCLSSASQGGRDGWREQELWSDPAR